MYDCNLHQSQHNFQVHQSQSLTWRPIIGHELNQSHSAMLLGRVPHSDLLEKWARSCRIFKARLSWSGLPKLMQFVWNDCEWGKSGVGAVALLRWRASCSWSTVSLKQLQSVQTVVHMMFSGQRGCPALGSLFLPVVQPTPLKDREHQNAYSKDVPFISAFCFSY